LAVDVAELMRDRRPEDFLALDVLVDFLALVFAVDRFAPADCFEDLPFLADERAAFFAIGLLWLSHDNR
jgi:hypothetical protein